MSSKLSAKQPLGQIQVPDRTFSEDLQLSDRYQNFSAELLRLSLLGITAIGFLVVNILFKDSAHIATKQFKLLLSGALVCLGISSAGALLHRYFSTDSLACHLRSLRLDLRAGVNDGKHSSKEKERRGQLFTWSARALLVSGVFLWLGATFLALSFIFGILYG